MDAVSPLHALPLAELRERTSQKWQRYPDDVLPLFVAESDFPLAPAIAETLRSAVSRGDTGYAASATPLAESYAGFARRRFGWNADPATMRSTADVSMGIAEIVQQVTVPGDRIVITPPVYPPFFSLASAEGRVAERVPLVDTGTTWRLDLDGIDAALAGGARAVLLCSPHNPTGTVHPRADLQRLAQVAAAHGAVVISDEIHAPLTQPDAGFVPFLTVSEQSRAVGFAVVSASKAFNLAGLKCALLVAGGEQPAATLRALPEQGEWRSGQFGVLASIAAFGGSSDAWLDSQLATLDGNRRLLAQLLEEHVPAARYRIPDAGYLAWIDLRKVGWGDDPADRILRDARVALSAGSMFGDEGKGHVRLNFGTGECVLTEAVTRIARLIDDRR